MEPIRQCQTSGTECGIAGSNRAYNNADHCEGNANTAHCLGAYIIDCCGLTFCQCSCKAGAYAAGDLVQSTAGCSPNQCDDAFSDHSAVEYKVTLFLTLHAASHQRGLRGMEAGNCTAGNRDEHEAPNRGAGRMHVVHMAPNFRNGVIRIGKDTKDYADCHNNQAKTKDRINLANDFINRDKRCDKVVNQNDNQPEQCRGNGTGQTAVFT